MARANLRSLISDESGATAIEYGLLAGLVAIAIIGSFSIMGNSLQSLFNTPSAGVLANQTAKLQ